MGSQREQSEGEEVRGVREDEGTDMEIVHGDDQGLDSAAIADQVADSVVGEGRPYLPPSLAAQAESLLVYGKRVGGPIGNLLEVAGQAITIAVMQYERTYGPFDDGPAPKFDLYRERLEARSRRLHPGPYDPRRGGA